VPQYSDVSDIKLQLRRLELDHVREEREREREKHQQQLELKKLDLEHAQEECQQQLELKKLELEMSRASDPSAHPTDPPLSRPPPFQVQAAVKWCLSSLKTM